VLVAREEEEEEEEEEEGGVFGPRGSHSRWRLKVDAER